MPHGNARMQKRDGAIEFQIQNVFLLYLLPRDGYFKAAFVFGQNATDTIFASSIDSYIQQELRAAKVYVEGRGIRIDVNDNTRMEDIKMLIRIKVGNI